jgi:predicted HicB family RNase H-like nuclease
VALVKYVNARFPDSLHEKMLNAANAEERPLSAWLRIAVKEKLARDSKKAGKK